MSTFRVRLTQGDRRTGSGGLDNQAQFSGTITAATNASPIVVTSASHGLVTGTRLTVVGVLGNTAANGTWTIEVVDTDSFKLLTSEGNATYTSGGTWNTVSIQRTMDAPGPNKTRRILADGELFTDCNYWKRFTYPTVPYHQAFIDLVEDDGSVYVDGEVSAYGRVHTLTVENDTTYTDDGNELDILDTYGSYAKFVQITVTGEDVTCRLNGNSSANLPISANTTQIFNQGDLPVSKLQFDNSVSGGSTATVVILVSIASTCNS